MRLAGVPVVRVLDVDRLLADLELLQHVRPGADLLGGIAVEPGVILRHDRAGVRAENFLEVRHALLQLQLDGLVVDLGDAAHVEHRAHDRPAVHLQGRIDHAGERVHHVVSRHRVAVAELDAVFQRDRVVVGGLGGDVLGNAVGVLRHELVAEAHQWLEAGDLPHDVGLGDDVLPVEDVVGTAEGADPQRTAGLAGRRRSGRCRRWRGCSDRGGRRASGCGCRRGAFRGRRTGGRRSRALAAASTRC